jgi:uncharacterized protein YigE (DUF2233 family)
MAWMPSLLVALAGWLITASTLSTSSTAAEPNPCIPATFENHAFTVCRADPAQQEFRLFLQRQDGANFSQLEALPSEGLLFATNAGMFTPEYAPAGLYVENAIERKSLNTRASGYGNFHLQPNGVFWLQDGKAAVSTTADYARLKPAAEIATQSGPMLVIDGKLNPKFDDDGPSRYLRNGVGVTSAGIVAVAISEEPVSFGLFARLFRDTLECPNALYFDGSVSRLRVTGTQRELFGPPLGPLLGVYRRSK